MADLLKWVRDRKKNVENVVDNVADVASRAVDHVNPLDGGRTWSQRTPTNNKSAFQQATHNAFTDAIGDSVVRPAVRLGIGVNHGIANVERKIAGLPTLDADEFMKQSFPSAPVVGEFAKYKGTKQQIAGDTLATASNVVAPGVAGMAKTGAAKVLPKAVPKLVPKVAGEAAAGAGLGAPQNVGSAMAESDDPLTASEALAAARDGAIGGAVFGAAAEVAAPAARAAANQVTKIPQAVNKIDAKAFSINGAPAPQAVREGGYVQNSGTPDAPAPTPGTASTSQPNFQAIAAAKAQKLAELRQQQTPTMAKPEVIAEAPTVQHVIEDEVVNREALRSSELDRAIQADLGRPGTTTQAIVNEHAKRAGMDSRQAQKDVWRVATESGYDIRDGIPVRATENKTPLAELGTGAKTEQEVIQSINEATEKLKVGYNKGIVGAKNAVVVKESPYQQLNMYIDENGEVRTFISQKRPDGNWQQIVNSDAPIKSRSDGFKSGYLVSDPDIQAEIVRASKDGITRQYIWTMNPDSGVTGLLTDGRTDPVTPKTMAYNPAVHVVEGGFVRDRSSGEILGNYVSVGPNGVQVQVGRQLVSLGVDPSKLNDGSGGLAGMVRSEGGNNSFNQAERWVEAVTKDEATRKRLRELVIYPTREAEASMKVEMQALGDGIKSWRQAFKDTIPAGKKKQALRDAVYVIEPSMEARRKLSPEAAKAEALQAFEQNYGPQAAQLLQSYDGWMRSAYDNMLERMNTVRRHNGMDEIPRRADYITHIQEIGNDTDKIYQSMREGIFGDVDGMSTRGKLPAQIAGRTEDFKPISKYNQYAKERKGDLKPSNPFDPLAVYGNVALHNIHMTQPASLVRSLETGLRAAQEFADNVPENFKDDAARAAWDDVAKRFAGQFSDSVEWLSEHANILSGKSSSWNRQMLKSEGGRRAITALNFMQKTVGRANILGNASSVVAQTLNLPYVIGTNGVSATMKGVARALTDPDGGVQSAFLKERYTDASNLIGRSNLEKALKPFGVPLGLVEKAFVHLAWNSSYEKALSKGLKGNEAVRAADSATSKIVAGRSIGDTAHVYNSVLGNTALQFTREVTEAWKNFTKDQSPYGKALTLASIFVMNSAVEGLTGRSPLPDPVGATVDTIKDFAEDDDESTAAEIGSAVQRGAATAVSAVPMASAIANQLPQDTRRVLFGSDSDLGRYDGAAAVTGPIKNIVSAGSKLVEGKAEEAAQSAVSVLPVGSQIRKTWQGTDTMKEGEVKDSKGRSVEEIEDKSPLDWAKAALFGRNAISEVRESYDKPNEAGSNVKSKGALGDAIKERAEKNKALNKRLEESLSDEENDIRRLSRDDRKALIKDGKLTQSQVDAVEKKVIQTRKKLGMTAGTNGQAVPEDIDGLHKNIRDFYQDRSYVSNDDRETWLTGKAEGNSAKLVEVVNSMKPEGLPDVPKTNEVAQLYAEFTRKRDKNKWSALQENEEKGKLLKNAYKTTLDGDMKFVNSLPAAKLIDAVDNGKISKELLDKTVAVDDLLVEMGFSADIPKSVRKEYGYSEKVSSYSSSSGSGSSGRRSRSGRSRSGGTAKDTPSASSLKLATTLPAVGTVRQASISPKMPTPPSLKMPRARKQKITNKNVALLLKSGKKLA